MTSRADRIVKEALQLPEAERADVAALLIDSLDSHVDADAETAWDTEIQRRIAEVDSGAVKPVPWPEARRMILGESNGPTAS